MAIIRSLKSSQPFQVPQAGYPRLETPHLLVQKTLTGQLHSQSSHVNTQILTIGKNRIIFSTGLSAISKTKYLQWKQLLWVHNNTELLPPAHLQLIQPCYNTQTFRRKPALPSWLYFPAWDPEHLQRSNLWSCPYKEGSEEPSPTSPDKNHLSEWKKLTSAIPQVTQLWLKAAYYTLTCSPSVCRHGPVSISGALFQRYTRSD